MANYKKKKQHREAVARYFKKLSEEGNKRIMIWADPNLQKKLDKAKSLSGGLSNPKLLDELLDLYLLSKGV